MFFLCGNRVHSGAWLYPRERKKKKKKKKKRPPGVETPGPKPRGSPSFKSGPPPGGELPAFCFPFMGGLNCAAWAENPGAKACFPWGEKLVFPPSPNFPHPKQKQNPAQKTLKKGG
eukprot:FR743067.1.p3 GENE.FR743067.1~~FR743067.1.p3  ORF type:complete len:116 (+),score=62.65 FR743067.1:836-1183(+)